MEDYFVHDFAPTFSVFGFELRYYGVLFASTFLIGYFLMRNMFLKQGYSEDKAQNFYFVALVSTVVGARLVHVFFYDFDRTMEDPTRIIEIWNGGVASHGGIIGLTLGCLGFAYFARVRFLDVLDSIAKAGQVGAILIRLGNWFNSEIVGRPTDVPWAVIFKRYSDDLPRHPTQFYESLYGVALLIILTFVDRWQSKSRDANGESFAGMQFAVGLMFYSLFRFFAEYLKEYQTLSSDFPFTMGQMLSMPMAIIAALMAGMVFKKGKERLAKKAA